METSVILLLKLKNLPWYCQLPWFNGVWCQFWQIAWELSGMDQTKIMKFCCLCKFICSIFTLGNTIITIFITKMLTFSRSTYPTDKRWSQIGCSEYIWRHKNCDKMDFSDWILDIFRWKHWNEIVHSTINDVCSLFCWCSKTYSKSWTMTRLEWIVFHLERYREVCSIICRDAPKKLR